MGRSGWSCDMPLSLSRVVWRLCSKPARTRKSGPGRACAAPTGKIWSCCWTASPPEGQQRSVVLSLKMAEAAAAAAITGEHPVLLLDDVLSELDDGRKQYLLTRMREKQTFVTSCDDTAFLKTDGEVYRMNGGVLSKI